jgi:replication factor C small subunit
MIQKSSLENSIWYERYRPHALAEMSLPAPYRRKFEEYIRLQDFPHLLLYGPQGSGKTTLAFVLMDSVPCVRMVLNASSGDRGIETMRGKVKQFASSQTLDGRLKVVFMDEFDGTTKDAQEALRNTVETYSKTCRFIFTCNEIDKINSPLQSRCTLFEFSAFPVEQVEKQCSAILSKEKIEYHPEDLQKIIFQHYPDIRSIINSIQLCSQDGILDPQSVAKTVVDPEKILDHIVNGEVGKIRQTLVGISTFTSIYRYLFDTLLSVEDLTTEEKTEIVCHLSESLYRDALVSNREIVFIDCCINIMSTLKCNSISFSL